MKGRVSASGLSLLVFPVLPGYTALNTRDTAHSSAAARFEFEACYWYCYSSPSLCNKDLTTPTTWQLTFPGMTKDSFLWINTYEGSSLLVSFFFGTCRRERIIQWFHYIRNIKPALVFHLLLKVIKQGWNTVLLCHSIFRLFSSPFYLLVRFISQNHQPLQNGCFYLCSWGGCEVRVMRNSFLR